MSLPEFTWPDWRNAPTSARFVAERTGRKGTYIKPARARHNGAIVLWDDQPFSPRRGVDGIDNHVYFVGIAREARPLLDSKGNHILAGQ